MKKEHEQLIHFEVKNINKVSVTHGDNIANTFPMHFHFSYSLGIIEQGQREFVYRGQETILKQNEVFIIMPFEPHSCKSVGNSKHNYKIISFNLDPKLYFPQLSVDDTELINLIKKFHYAAENENFSENIKNIFKEIIYRLKRYSSDYNNYNMNEENIFKIDTARNFIENNCNREVSLKEMAEIVSLSEFHFNRLFHKCFGLSPYAYYLVCKMRNSQKALVKNDSATETTYDIGCFDQSHFTRLFKKYFGVTPGKYLRDNK